MKKVYTKLSFQQYSFIACGSPILKGSLSGFTIEVPSNANIPVKDYENGFETDDFEISF